MEGTQKKGQKIVLTRRRRETTIQQNLTHMEMATLKKKMAQQRYYEKKQVGESPLRRNVDAKGSVHQRLGGPQTAEVKTEKGDVVILSRSKFRWKQTNKEGIYTKGYRLNMLLNERNRNYPRNQAQKRLEHLRRQLSTNTYVVRGKQNNLARRDNNMQKPMNLTVQVKNSPQQVKHSIHGAITPMLQEQIRMMQSMTPMQHCIPNLPITIGVTGATKMLLNERFMGYP